jgi:hypothetical protein
VGEAPGLARNRAREMLKQSEVDDATMRIEVSLCCIGILANSQPKDPSRIVGSGFIQFPPQRPFQQSVVVQPPTVVVSSKQESTIMYLNCDQQLYGKPHGSATASGSRVRHEEIMLFPLADTIAGFSTVKTRASTDRTVYRSAHQQTCTSQYRKLRCTRMQHTRSSWGNKHKLSKA